MDVQSKTGQGLQTGCKQCFLSAGLSNCSSIYCKALGRFMDSKYQLKFRSESQVPRLLAQLNGSFPVAQDLTHSSSQICFRFDLAWCQPDTLGNMTTTGPYHPDRQTLWSSTLELPYSALICTFSKILCRIVDRFRQYFRYLLDTFSGINEQSKQKKKTPMLSLNWNTIRSSVWVIMATVVVLQSN